jgi:hypothetical protein
MVMVRLDLQQLEQELGAAASDVALEVANTLVNELKVEAPTGATGSLQNSIQIFRTGDGVVWLGTRIPYAKGVWKGKPPHTPDFDAIEVWARRVLGDESAAGPVYRKIQQEGTEGDDFVGRAIENTIDRVGQFRLNDFR